MSEKKFFREPGYLLLLPFLSTSPVYASGMDGIGNAGAILMGLCGAFLVSLVTGPLLRQYMATRYLRIDLLQPSHAFAITVLEWFLWIGSMVYSGTHIFPGGLTIPALLGTVFSISLLLNFFVPKPAADQQQPEIAERLKYAAVVSLTTFAYIFLVTFIIARNF
ncbi:MAG TPA: hypothetical protein PLM07_17920 [Candidatus Rifleibacterium sp.]|nr:hypothetical protein [Candidatus Rifleibacterium sp.]HPT47760.1 hypothetical protein [Candidatus Rifleibacterium sp.]